MTTQAYFVHALSPLHAGIGQAADIVDLPTARQQATGIPFVPGSSVKGVLRDASRNRGADAALSEAVFGPPQSEAAEFAGALVVGDARLLALPVRSMRGVFAWVSSPLLLALAQRDWASACGLPLPHLEGRRALVAGSTCLHQDKLYLADIELQAKRDAAAEQWAKAIPAPDYLQRRFAIADDETVAFLCETALQVDARVRIDEQKRTVATGALWLEESLPAETFLIGLAAADRSRKPGVAMTPPEVMKLALSGEAALQFGGKASVGRGRCRLIPATIAAVAHA